MHSVLFYIDIFAESGTIVFVRIDKEISPDHRAVQHELTTSERYLAQENINHEIGHDAVANIDILNLIFDMIDTMNEHFFTLEEVVRFLHEILAIDDG